MNSALFITMRLCHVLTLFLVLCDGRPGLSRAQTQVYTAAEGGNITAKFVFSASGNLKIFCKNNCDKTENILVETSDNRKQNGRYSIENEEDSSFMSVSITNVRSSDSGTYRCETWEGGAMEDYEEFLINITSDPAVTPRPSVPSVSYNGTTTQRTRPSSGGVLLPVALTAVGIFISLTLFILYWRKRDNNPQEAPVSTEYAQIPEGNHEYEEIPDKNRPGPVEKCPAYVSFSNTTETSTVYSLVSAPCGQTQTEDCSSKVTYADVDLTKSSSAPRSQTEAAAGAVQTEDVTLYSTIR